MPPIKTAFPRDRLMRVLQSLDCSAPSHLVNRCCGRGMFKQLAARAGMEEVDFRAMVNELRGRILGDAGLGSRAEIVGVLGNPVERLRVAERTGLSQDALLVELACQEQVIDVRFDRYQGVKLLGRGRWCEVYLARDPEFFHAPLVAIKRVRPELVAGPNGSALVQRLMAQAKWTRNLEHRQIVDVYESVADGEASFVVLEYMEGGNLSSWLRRHPNATLGEILGLLDAVLTAVEAIHTQSWHGNLSFGNILFDAQEEMKISDIGYSLAPTSREKELVRGNRFWRGLTFAPEQRSGGGSPASDIFALGLLLWRLLAQSRVQLTSRQHAVLVGIVKKASDKDGSLRYPNAPSLSAALKRARRRGLSKGEKTARFSPLEVPPEPELSVASLPSAKEDLVSGRLGGFAILLIAAALLGGWLIPWRPESPKDFFLRHYPVASEERIQTVLGLSPVTGEPQGGFWAVTRSVKDGVESRLVALGSDGEIRWEQPIGKPLRFSDWIESGSYEVLELRRAMLGAEREGIVVLSSHSSSWPGLLLVFDAKTGERVLDYVHAGPLVCVEIADFDGDGADEVIVGGTNVRTQPALQGHAAATLAVLPITAKGRSPGMPEMLDRNLASGQELAYVRFPVSDVGGFLLEGRHTVRKLMVTERGTVRPLLAVEVEESGSSSPELFLLVRYRFDGRTLEPLGTVPSPEFRWRRERLVDEQRLRTPLDQNYLTELQGALRYWKEGLWVPLWEWKNPLLDRLPSPGDE